MDTAITTSEQTAEVSKAFVKAQSNMPRAIKRDSTNPHFKSSYASLTAVSDAILPVFHKAGIAVFMSQNNGTMTCRLLHESGEWIDVTIPFATKDATNPQSVGSAITYCRRYLLGLVSGVPTEDDDDGNEAARQKKSESKREVSEAPVQEGEWPIGKHKGTAISDLPLDYLEWAAREIQNEDARHRAEQELERRKANRQEFEDAEIPF